MAIGPVVTGGLGNGTLTTTIPLVLLRGLFAPLAADAATTTACAMRGQGYTAGASVGQGYTAGASVGQGFESGNTIGEGC